jgi:hypothetical protein
MSGGVCQRGDIYKEPKGGKSQEIKGHASLRNIPVTDDSSMDHMEFSLVIYFAAQPGQWWRSRVEAHQDQIPGDRRGYNGLG